jgi:hypothetical protein
VALLLHKQTALIVARLVKKFSTFTDSVSSLPSPQDPVIELYPQPYCFNINFNIIIPSKPTFQEVSHAFRISDYNSFS